MFGWLARGEAALPAGPDWLAPAEAARAAGMRHPKRRTEYLLRRLAAKHAVAAVTGRPAADPAELARIEVASAPSGAPYVLLDGRPADLQVSLTDRAGWAVCLVGPAGAGPAGCDLELVEARSAAFIADFLTPAERRHVADQPDDDARHAAATLVWSAKESALKVLRTGLDRDTRTVEVTVLPGGAGDWAGLAVRVTGEGTLSGWWRRDGRFLLTVAAAAPLPPPAALEDPAVLAAVEPAHSWLDHPHPD